MASLKLKQGSKGKLVGALQKFLNLKAKLPKPIPEDGDFGPGTKDAVRFFQKKARLTMELDGTVGPETAGALAKLVGPAATSFLKAFGDAEEAQAANKDQYDVKPAKPAEAKAVGKPGKVGNVLHQGSGYLISIPPTPATKFPLLVLFGGTTGKGVLIAATPESYFRKAILVFLESNGSFSTAQSLLKPVLAQTQTKTGSISICGYSLGGQAAFRNYGSATKTVGLIDPTTYDRDVAKLDTKAIFSCNPDNWSLPKYARIVAAQRAAEKSSAGIYEKTSVKHGPYPQYFLGKFEASLI